MPETFTSGTSGQHASESESGAGAVKVEQPLEKREVRGAGREGGKFADGRHDERECPGTEFGEEMIRKL